MKPEKINRVSVPSLKFEDSDASNRPAAIRGKGAGFAAAFAKIEAVLTAFFFPILLAGIGTQALLYGLIVTSILGAVVTWLFRIETTGVKLDRLE